MQARKLLQAATQTAPDDFHEWMALGDFEVRQGKWTDATAALQKGLATPVTGDDRLSLYRKLGQAQERNLDTAAALATWQKMVQEFPKDSFALEEAGAAELDAEQFDEAKKTFQKLVDLTEPNSMNRVQALMRLAEVDDRQGKADDAVHDYEAILPLTAESSWLNRELRAQIEQVYRRQDDLAGLVTYYQKWTTDNPKDVEALLLLAATQDELGKKTEALDVLRKVTVLAPDRHEVRERFAQGLGRGEAVRRGDHGADRADGGRPDGAALLGDDGRCAAGEDATADAGKQKGGAGCVGAHCAGGVEGCRRGAGGGRSLSRPRAERRGAGGLSARAGVDAGCERYPREGGEAAGRFEADG